MILHKHKPYELCPEYDGQAVCVDATPLRELVGPFGKKAKFRLVYETTELLKDGKPFIVSSPWFTTSLHPKSALFDFLTKWLGQEPDDDLDTEGLVGKPAKISVVHVTRDGKTFDRIGLIRPDRSATPLQPSGGYVRVIDRDGTGTTTGTVATATTGPEETGDDEREPF